MIRVVRALRGYGALIAKTFFWPRKMIRPSEIAGVAMSTSPTGFFASSS